MELSISTGNPKSIKIIEPHNDLEFDSHEMAYEYYKEYAKSEGFGTAKLSSRRSRASKEFIDAKFSCIRYGNKQQSDDAINPRPSPKIGCKASMHVKRKPNQKWYIHSFIKEHNHELLPAQAHFFRSHRNTDSDSKVKRRKLLSGVGNKQYNPYQFSGSLESFLRNQHDKGRRLSLEEGDAQLLLELFACLQEKDPKFFYAVDFNEEHQLRNVFWVDSKGVNDYTYFGDVVSFETMYFTNKYKIPLVLFLGVNHHVQPIILGSALIADDTVYTFAWLMKTWRLAMGGRGPQVLLTDQIRHLRTAVSAIFPETRHCYSLYSILEKVPGQLDYLSLWHETFMMKFTKCVHKSFTEEQFEKRWSKLVDRFNLREVEWINLLHEDRKLWVPVFVRDVSVAGLSPATRTDCTNSFFDNYVNPETTLQEFIKLYNQILEDIYENEAQANFNAWHETPELKSPSPFEKQVLLVYTHEIFKKFQVEVLGASACHLKKDKEEGSTITYAVKDFDKNQDFTVKWDEKGLNLYCSCLSFEYKGYICRHAIIVLQMSGVFSLPRKYILQRWTNIAKSRHPIGEKLEEVQIKVRRFNDLCRRGIILGEEGSLSSESYDFALGAIREAFKQCVGANNCIENDQDKEQGRNCQTTEVNRGLKRVSGKEKVNDDGNGGKKGKVPFEFEVANDGTSGAFQQMDMCNNSEDYPANYPRFLTTLLRSDDLNKRSVEMLGEMLEEQS